LTHTVNNEEKQGTSNNSIRSSSYRSVTQWENCKKQTSEPIKRSANSSTSGRYWTFAKSSQRDLG